MDSQQQTDSVVTHQTTCIIVGGGPAGMVLALLLARAGVEVMVLELHQDFDRDFRGDSLHPSALELVDELGLMKQLEALPHINTTHIPIKTKDANFSVLDHRYVDSRFKYLMFVRQSSFLELLKAEAARYPTFHILMGAGVRELLVEGDVVQGVRYTYQGTMHEMRAALTIGTDGRHSMVRKLSGLKNGAVYPMSSDWLWFRLPYQPGDPTESHARVSGEQVVGLLRREDHWQVSYNFPKGTYPQLKAAGLPAFRSMLATVLPEFTTRLDHDFTDWRQGAVLSIEVTRLARWYRPGLLLIGDAAHVMSPAFGVGINYAIQDAVAAANLLAPHLLTFQQYGTPIPERALRAVQRRRFLPTFIVQTLQNLASGEGKKQEKEEKSSNSQVPVVISHVLGAPGIRNLLAHIMGVGLWRERIRIALPEMPQQLSAASSTPIPTPLE